jgi:hypothetical protein
MNFQSGRCQDPPAGIPNPNPPKEFIFFLPYHEMTLAMVEADRVRTGRKIASQISYSRKSGEKAIREIPAQAELGRTTLEI